uniref:Uncharacterized protein n=1 Tax=Rhynchopus euleeides TaxID=630703 RepID=A0A2D2AJW0_9EUGL|nr:hypothetical protein [Rhynchopus euleeides]
MLLAVHTLVIHLTISTLLVYAIYVVSLAVRGSTLLLAEVAIYEAGVSATLHTTSSTYTDSSTLLILLAHYEIAVVLLLAQLWSHHVLVLVVVLIILLVHCPSCIQHL